MLRARPVHSRLLLSPNQSSDHWGVLTRVSLEGRDGIIELEAERVRGGLLHAPLRTAMHQRVEETLDARITLRHRDHDGRTLLEGTAQASGLEVFGDTDRLLGL